MTLLSKKSMEKNSVNVCQIKENFADIFSGSKLSFLNPQN
jgi:hypothetical protein